MTALLLLAVVSAHPAREAAEIAVPDLEALAPAFRPQRIYLYTKQTTVEARGEVLAGVSLMLNSISRARAIRVPAPMDPEIRIIKVDLAAYIDHRKKGQYKEIDAARAALVLLDPYTHLRAGIFNFESGELAETLIDGPWMGPAAAELQKLTGSKGTIFNAEWFLCQLSDSAYYQWAGTPSRESEFFTQLGIDPKQHEALAADTGANLLRSGVTHKGRRIVRRQGPLGGAWQTLDSATETPDRDPIRTPVDKGNVKFVHDASEHFALGANKLWRYALYDGAGNRQASVPERIAKDRFRLDGVLRPLVSCTVCHNVEGESGIQPFADIQSILPLGPGTDIEVAQRIVEFYDPAAHAVAVTRDAQDYAEAVKACTGGMLPKEAALVLDAVYREQVEDPVTLSVAASEVGLSDKAAVGAWGASEDPTISLLLRGQSVTRAAFETVFAECSQRAVMAQDGGLAMEQKGEMK